MKYSGRHTSYKVVRTALSKIADRGTPVCRTPQMCSPGTRCTRGTLDILPNIGQQCAWRQQYRYTWGGGWLYLSHTTILRLIPPSADIALCEHNIPYFQPLLDVFSLSSLTRILGNFVHTEMHLRALPPVKEAAVFGVEAFLSSFRTSDRSSPDFAIKVSKMWPSHQSRVESLAVFSIALSMDRQQTMIASIAAWTWLTQECAKEILAQTKLLMVDPVILDSDEHWLHRLTRDIYHMPSSVERGILRNISVLVLCCAPKLQGLVDDHVQDVFAHISNSITLSEDNLPVHNPPHQSILQPAFIVNLPSACQCEEGLKRLLQFVQALLPLAKGARPSTPLQKLVASNPDFYSPFRELATSWQKLTLSRGAFNSHYVQAPGSFPMWIISRALLFNLHVLLDCEEFYFEDESDWDTFRDIHGYGPSEQASVDRFFNVRCYGMPQYERCAGVLMAPVYFDTENDWLEFNGQYTDKVPFMDCWKWLQVRVVRAGIYTGRLRKQPRLPLVGALGVWLLTADMSYAGVVQVPKQREVAYITHKNCMGSLTGLCTAKQLVGKDVLLSTAVLAFSNVADYLRIHVEDEDKLLIHLDDIMVEHLLCKYSRVRNITGTTNINIPGYIAGLVSSSPILKLGQHAIVIVPYFHHYEAHLHLEQLTD
ncbi:hypothetical protein C8Q80DRAFT_1123399 [Daedaleopsis nitida]|nr:hypothetical protein C8Q80DRAFT_1123399 [Daedaleopsis nitida]